MDSAVLQNKAVLKVQDEDGEFVYATPHETADDVEFVYATPHETADDVEFE